MTHCTLALLCVLMVTAAVAMAADKSPLPSPQQLAWQRHEFIAFAHFGMNTFTDREWGDGREDPKLFNPTDFDAKQWAAVLQEAGVRLLILTAKHHDGFCLWPSNFTEHCVKNSPWRGGRGDVVREVVDALREKKIGVGLYLSPWDRNQPTYGDSAKYNQYFRNQLRELLTNYGVIDEVWFDGACGEGPNGKKQEYDWASYYALIRELQPHALIAICGPDVRWVGNETGVAREDESSVQKRDGKSVWYPAECDVSIRPGWFYHASEDKSVKSLATLADIYFKSVGRNSVLLLNIPPDRRGSIGDADVARLKEFRAFVDQLYATDFVAAATVIASSRPDSSGHERQLQGRDLDTSWVPARGQTTGQVEFDLGRPRTFNVARIQEDISLGERVQAYHVEILDGDKWRTVTAGQVIGHKQLRRFPAVTAQRTRLVIDKAAAPPTISEFGLHWNPLASAGPGGLSDHRPTTASDVHPGTTQPDLKKGDVVFKANFGNATEREKWSRAAFAKWAEAGPDGSMCLVIDVAGGEKPGSHVISIPLDLTPYRVAVLFFECRAKAENVTKPPQPYNGVKYMLHYKSAKGEHWNNQNNVYGTFDWKTLSFSSPIADDATEGELVLGLAMSTGKAWFDSIRVTVLLSRPPSRPAPNPSAPPAYKGHDLPRLRGVMSPNQFKDEDLRVLGVEWKANLIRWQITRNWGKPGTDRDLDEYDKWFDGKLDELDKALEACKRYGLKAVIDMHSPPGGRYEDSSMAMFYEKKYQDHFVKTWEKIARRCRANPAVWAYDLVNEPVAKKPTPGGLDYLETLVRAAKAIRVIDPATTILIASGDWGGPQAFPWLMPVDVPNVVYQVHMYVPHAFTHQGVGGAPTGGSYPGKIGNQEYDKEALRKVLKPVREFQLAYNVHIYVGEFSAIRWAPGAARYLSDCIDIFEEYGWDWSYHAYREWTGWSVEDENQPMNIPKPATTDTDRKKLLLSWFAKNTKPHATSKPSTPVAQ